MSDTPLVKPPFLCQKCGLSRGVVTLGVEINTFMIRCVSSNGLSKGVGLSSGWPLKRGYTL